MDLPTFDDDGLLPSGDYEMSLGMLKRSMLVEGPGEEYPDWDFDWRLKLVENLEYKPKGIIKIIDGGESA